MPKPKRKHRRVRKSWEGCGCPKGTKKVTTCSIKNGKKVCRGRGWGCLGVGKSKTGKPTPRFFAAVCPTKPKLLPAGTRASRRGPRLLAS